MDSAILYLVTYGNVFLLKHAISHGQAETFSPYNEGMCA